MIKTDLYTLTPDAIRNISTEDINGKYTDEDYLQYCEDYKKIIVKFNGKPWAKKCNLKGFQLSVSDNLINDHIKWCIENNLQYVATIVDSAITKMKMNRSLRKAGGPVVFEAFDSEADADEHVK